LTLDIRELVPLLQVYDMPTSLRFYRDKLGFTVAATSPEMGDDYFHWVMLRLGEAELMLNTAFESNDERPPKPEAARVAAHGDTGLFFACPDVDGAYQELRSKGVEANAPTVAPYGMKQLYLRDPDGYELCFQWPVKS
jgi:glyoxylase I family protein